jgi:hypothetical protein
MMMMVWRASEKLSFIYHYCSWYCFLKNKWQPLIEFTNQQYSPTAGTGQWKKLISSLYFKCMKPSKWLWWWAYLGEHLSKNQIFLIVHEILWLFSFAIASISIHARGEQAEYQIWRYQNPCPSQGSKKKYMHKIRCWMSVKKWKVVKYHSYKF